MQGGIVINKKSILLVLFIAVMIVCGVKFDPTAGKLYFSSQQSDGFI